jgi:hypothetical protein
MCFAMEPLEVLKADPIHREGETTRTIYVEHVASFATGIMQLGGPRRATVPGCPFTTKRTYKAMQHATTVQPLRSKTRLYHKNVDGKFKGLELS